MTINDVYEFGGECWSDAMKLIDLGPNTYQNWLRKGYIPMATQLRIEKVTHKRLKADINLPKESNDKTRK